jgi:hypothetical protein
MFVAYLTWNVSGLLGHNNIAITTRAALGILHINHTLFMRRYLDGGSGVPNSNRGMQQ